MFWGCSIEDEFMTPEVVEDLKGFDLITVREPLSYEVLKNYGIFAVQVADPAFLLNKKNFRFQKDLLKKILLVSMSVR